MAAQSEPHVLAVTLTMRAMTKVFGDENYYVRPPGPIRQGSHSKPEPDVAVVFGNARTYATKKNPTGALIVIEVADSTLRYDRGKKGSIYAKNQIADYWIANLVDCQVEVYRDPVADASSGQGHRFASVQIFKRGTSVAPLAMPDGSIAVEDLLP